MIKVMLDNDLAGHIGAFRDSAVRDGWGDLCLIEFISLADAGLALDATDRVIWHYCQENGVILLTGNRNEKAPDSLESTIKENNTSESLPVVTVADPQRLGKSEYRSQCLESLFEITLDINNYLGTARIYIP